MRRAVFVLVALFGGCLTTQQSLAPPAVPEVISMTPLPLLPKSFIEAKQDQRRLHVLFCVRTDGTVADVRLLSLSGDSAWDKAAVDSMLRWRFASITDVTSDDHLWVRRDLVVKAHDPIVMSIGEIVAGSKDEADSLYLLLMSGTSFDTLAHPAFTVAPRELWRPRMVDIACYPGHVREQLVKLGVNDVTAPIRLGKRYVIYKRFEASYAGESKTHDM